MATIGFFRFHSPLFLAATVLLVLVTCACTLERWRTVWRQAFWCWTRTPCAAGVGDGSPRWSLSALAWCSSLVGVPWLVRVVRLESVHGF